MPGEHGFGAGHWAARPNRKARVNFGRYDRITDALNIYNWRRQVMNTLKGCLSDPSVPGRLPFRSRPRFRQNANGGYPQVATKSGQTGVHHVQPMGAHSTMSAFGQAAVAYKRPTWARNGHPHAHRLCQQELTSKLRHYPSTKVPIRRNNSRCSGPCTPHIRNSPISKKAVRPPDGAFGWCLTSTFPEL